MCSSIRLDFLIFSGERYTRTQNRRQIHKGQGTLTHTITRNIRNTYRISIRIFFFSFFYFRAKTLILHLTRRKCLRYKTLYNTWNISIHVTHFSTILFYYIFVQYFRKNCPLDVDRRLNQQKDLRYKDLRNLSVLIIDSFSFFFNHVIDSLHFSLHSNL